jgi:hypothetical protein
MQGYRTAGVCTLGPLSDRSVWTRCRLRNDMVARDDWICISRSRGDGRCASSIGLVTYTSMTAVVIGPARQQSSRQEANNLMHLRA